MCRCRTSSSGRPSYNLHSSPRTCVTLSRDDVRPSVAEATIARYKGSSAGSEPYDEKSGSPVSARGEGC